MGRKAAELGPLAVSRLTEPGLHAVGGVAGLYLQVLPTGARSWILRVRIGGKRRDMGLGGFPDVTLAGARDKARKAREKIEEGIDPIEERRALKSTLLSHAAKVLTFKKAAEDYIKEHRAEWRNPKHQQQWANTLSLYAYPVLGNMDVRHIERSHVLKVLKPIWQEKTETATRLRGRMEKVLSAAAFHLGVEGYVNPARWEDGLEHVLATPSKVARVKHHAALPLDDVPAFMTRLRDVQGMGARALEFAILTAARSGEVRGATWAEIDLKEKVWTVPAERMKARREHRVPLSPAAVALLEKLPRLADCNLVFPSPTGRPLSDMTLTAVLRRLDADAVPHGFRSTFRDWASERTNYPRDAAEMALAHTIGDKVEAAYRRGDLFMKRRRMMEDWAKFCGRPVASADVVDLEGRRA